MKLFEKKSINSQFLTMISFVILIAFCLFAGVRYSENITLVQALGGWSPIDWVAHQLYPDNFNKDFPSGISAYRMSSLMQLYLYAASFGIELEKLMAYVIRFEILFLGVGAAVLFRSIAPQAPFPAMAIFGILIVEGSVRDMELARFGGAFYQGLYYNIADAFRLLALAALFRGRIVMAAVLFGIAFTIHPVMAGMAVVFAIPFIIMSLKRFPFRHWVFASLVLLGIAGVWFLFQMQSAEVGSGGIPNAEWLGLVRMFSYHWFPADIGVFTRFHARYILPLLCLVFMAVLYMPRVIQGNVERRCIAWGIALLSIFTCLGVVISEFSSEPFMVKLALHRASDMLIFICLLILVAGLSDEALNGRILETALAGVLLLSPMVSAPFSFPVIVTALLLGLHVLRAHIERNKNHFLILLSALTTLLSAVVLFYVIGIDDFSAYIGSGTLGYLGVPLLWWLGFAFLLTAMLRWCCKFVKIPDSIVFSVLGMALVGVVLFYSTVSLERKSLMPDSKKDLAFNYLSAQRWASENTSNESLFMVDPTIYYGWRDFSQRSSFGSLREWLHTGWLYDSRLAVYEEGRKRFEEFGIDIEKYKRVRPSIDGYHQLSENVKREFYSKSDAWFQDLSRRYGIDYLVMNKEFVTRDVKFTKCFENNRFVVYKISK